MDKLCLSPSIDGKINEANLLHSKCQLIDDLTGEVPSYDRATILNIIKSCRKEKNLLKTRRIHADIAEKKMIPKDAHIATSLITTYSACGSLQEAQEVFDQMLVQDVVCWSALICGYAQNGLGDKALECFRQMGHAGIQPNAVTYICILRACAITRSLSIGKMIEGELRKEGLLDEDIVLGTTLMDMYFKCCDIEKARTIFEQLHERNVVTWSAVISGYAHNGKGDEALKCFRKMKEEGIHPNSVTYISILKACGLVGSLDIGQDVHVEVREKGLLQKDLVLCNALLDMYSKCGAIENARQLFEQLPQRNIISWNSLISGYGQIGHGEQALKCFKQMENEGIHPDEVTYICCLKACGIMGSLEMGEYIHSHIRKQGFEKVAVIGSALVDMYSKCGALKKAHGVFNQLQLQDVVSWNSLIAGYIQHGLAGDALKCFRDMEDAGILPDKVTYICILKACGIVGCLEIGEKIDVNIRKNGLLLKDKMLDNALLDMYSKCGALGKVRDVFEQLPEQDIFSWNALITGYVHIGEGAEVLRCFKQMQDVGVYPDSITHTCVLKACGLVGSLEIGESIHAEITKQGLLMKDSVLAALMDMYIKCGAFQKARKIFEELPEQNPVSWSAMINAYAQNGCDDKVMECFRRMQDQNVFPNAVSYSSILKACGSTHSLEIGEMIHAEIRKQGLLEKDVVLGTALVDMYCKCSVLEKAKEVFQRIEMPNVISWNVMIDGYAQHGLGDEALKCYGRMKDAGICPNIATYVLILKACGIVGSVEPGRNVHAEISFLGLLQKNIELGNALMDMYSKCGKLENMREVFAQLPVHDVVSWNVLLTGYVQNGHPDEVLKYFRKMQSTEVCPDAITYICILKACGMLGSLEMGIDMDVKLRKQGLLKKEVMLGTAVVDMYSKCGAVKNAHDAFDQLTERSTGSWNALISGYGQLGEASMVLDLYKRMRTNGVVPNSVTFIILLNACSHAGLMGEGEFLFSEMLGIGHHLAPTLEHYICMIDLFGRAGCFDKLTATLDMISYSMCLPLLQSILGSCKKWRNVVLGKWAFDQLLRLDDKCAAAYICMENIFVMVGMKEKTYCIETSKSKNRV